MFAKFFPFKLLNPRLKRLVFVVTVVVVVVDDVFVVVCVTFIV